MLRSITDWIRLQQTVQAELEGGTPNANLAWAVFTGIVCSKGLTQSLESKKRTHTHTIHTQLLAWDACADWQGLEQRAEDPMASKLARRVWSGSRSSYSTLHLRQVQQVLWSVKQVLRTQRSVKRELHNTLIRPNLCVFSKRRIQM